jgi:hypothetical protein
MIAVILPEFAAYPQHLHALVRYSSRSSITRLCPQYTPPAIGGYSARSRQGKVWADSMCSMTFLSSTSVKGHHGQGISSGISGGGIAILTRDGAIGARGVDKLAQVLELSCGSRALIGVSRDIDHGLPIVIAQGCSCQRSVKPTRPIWGVPAGYGWPHHKEHRAA